MKTQMLRGISPWFAAIFLAGAITQTAAQGDPMNSWQLRSEYNTADMAYGNGVFVGIYSGDGIYAGAFATSQDGINWTRYISPFPVSFQRIVFATGSFFAIGPSPTVSTNSIIITSSDGQTWTQVYETTGAIRDGVAGNGQLVFVGDKIIATPTVGGPWREFQVFGLTCQGVTFGNGRFVATATAAPSWPSASHIISSSDGWVWRYDYGPVSTQGFGGIGFGTNLFVATWSTNENGGCRAGFLTSTNLQDWQAVTVTNRGSYLSGLSLGRATFGGDQFVGVFGPWAYSSTNGINWVLRPLRASGIAFGQGTFVAGGSSGIWQSGMLTY
jgi:hypothetical protein